MLPYLCLSNYSILAMPLVYNNLTIILKYKFGIYVGWSIWYLDVDECAIANGGCEHVCINTNGSFYCDCHEGHALESDNRQCGGKKKDH